MQSLWELACKRCKHHGASDKPTPPIVTKSAKSVYQNPLCLPSPHLLKIHSANTANAINNVTAPTKAVNPALAVKIKN